MVVSGSGLCGSVAFIASSEVVTMQRPDRLLNFSGMNVLICFSQSNVVTGVPVR